MKQFTINLYSIEELNKDAKFKAIEEHKDFLLSVYSDSDFDESYNMTYETYEKELSEEEIIEDIKCNDYLFFYDGELADIVHYCGNHQKSWITELTLNGETYA